MTKNKYRIFPLILGLFAVGLSFSSTIALATTLDIQIMAVFQSADNLQVAVNQTSSVLIEIYNGDGELVKILEPTFDTGGILALDWNATGTRLAAIYVTGAQHPNVVIWDVATSTIIAEQQIDFARYVYWNPVDSDVLMIVLGTTIMTWDISSNAGLGLTTYDPSWTDIEYAEWSPNGTYIALLGSVGKVRVVDAQTHAVIFERDENLPITERINYYFSLNFSPSEDRIALYDLASVEVEIWNILTNQLEVSFDSFDTNSQHYEILRWLDGGLVGIDFRLEQSVVYDLSDGSFNHIVNGVRYSGAFISPTDNTILFVLPQVETNSPFFVEVELPGEATPIPPTPIPTTEAPPTP